MAWYNFWWLEGELKFKREIVNVIVNEIHGDKNLKRNWWKDCS